MHIQEVFDLVRDDIDKLERDFRKNLVSDIPLVGKVGDYILSSGGKRYRPLVVFLCARLCGLKGEGHVPLAGVVEFIHTATLLHDDVVDKARLRRGVASANVVWGDGASILVGDFLLSRAFQLAVTHGNDRILKVLSQTTTCMAEAEVMQLAKYGDVEMSEKDYLRIITGKTAVLFSASAQFPAIYAGVSLEEEIALANYGLSLGAAYQLVDDCLDYTSTDEDLGKAIGTDLREGKATLPLIQAYKKASRAEKDAIKAALESKGLTDEGLKGIIAIIDRHKGIDYAMEIAGEQVENAKKNLDLFKPDADTMALRAVADYVIARQY